MQEPHPTTTQADHVFLVRPARFFSNEETRSSNHFQEDLVEGDETQAACAEFETLHQELVDFGIEVLVFESDIHADTPDAIFPNNWISMHPEGFLFLYPMEAKNRRRERRQDIVEALQKKMGPYEIIDLSPFEKEGQFLEGTGSMVFDRSSRHIFCGLSTRSHLAPLGEVARKLGYSAISFQAFDSQRRPIYHTNVMMSMGQDCLVVCLESILDGKERQLIIDYAKEYSKEIVELSFDQLKSFCGNCLLLQNREGQRSWWMSERAYRAFSRAQLQVLEREGQIRSVPLPTIEAVGGGSLRCMIAEVFPPRAG